MTSPVEGGLATGVVKRAKKRKRVAKTAAMGEALQKEYKKRELKRKINVAADTGLRREDRQLDRMDRLGLKPDTIQEDFDLEPINRFMRQQTRSLKQRKKARDPRDDKAMKRALSAT